MGQKERAFAAIFAGLFTGFAIIMGLEYLSPYRPPEGLDVENKQQMGDWIQTLPITAFLLLLAIYFVAAVAAGFVANKVAGPTRYRPALIAGVGLLVAGALNLLQFPHPIWFVALSSAAYLVGAWQGGRMAK